MAKQSDAKHESPTALPSDGLVPLESILCTEELDRRPSRPPDYATENRALAALVQALADSPRTILQTLADKILEVFKADSAGISLLTKEDGGKRFYWPAIAGVWKPHIGGGTPRDFGPCGDVLDRNAALLFRHFERRYTYFLPVTPPIEECLLVPFYVEGKAVGTIWAITHDDRRKFDAEDLRQLESLGRFASAAYQATEFLDELEQRGDALGQSHSVLAQRMADLQKVNTEAQNSRRAALNLMEDAVQSRKLVETLNLQLLGEIAERNQAQEALRQNQAQLETRVAERTTELQQVNAALEHDIAERKKLEEQLLQAQKMESIGVLGGGIAHDFNNILNIIQGYASLLGKPSAENNQLAETLEAINEAVQRGAAVVRQLLIVARKSETRLEPTDTNDLIRGLAKLLKETLPKNIEVTLDLIDVPLVMADAGQINQVLLNLCVNARDAMPQGGKLSLKTEVVSGIELGQGFKEGQEKGYVRIRVSDTGIGIDAETRTRIFEPFFTTKARGQGTGLGLSVAYGVINNHGGFINVTSEVDQGTTFDIYLPLPKNEPELVQIKRQPEPERKGTRPGAGATVLLVDDEIRQLRLMKNLLETEGFKVLPASDGAEAVETHLRHKDEIAVAILDLQLPKMNGLEAFRTMRKIQPKLRALFATGFSSPEVEAEIVEEDMGDIIMKPYPLDSVLEKISEILQKPPPSLPE